MSAHAAERAALAATLARQVEIELGANASKGTWVDASIVALERELVYHVLKLLTCQGPEALTEHAADVAAGAAMLAHRRGGMRAPQPGNYASYFAGRARTRNAGDAEKVLALLDLLRRQRKPSSGSPGKS